MILTNILSLPTLVRKLLFVVLRPLEGVVTSAKFLRKYACQPVSPTGCICYVFKQGRTVQIGVWEVETIGTVANFKR